MRYTNETILLVDDDPDVLSALEAMVDGLGYPLIAKPDALTALSIVKAGAKIDLVISDYQMPSMNGAEFVSALKRMQPAVPVIMLTGCSMAKVDTVSGVFKYVKKPIERKELHRIIKAALSQA